MEYLSLDIEDFKRVFDFGTEYYIDPTKNTTGRTTGEPRGLGAILDAFTLGKLTEIGVEKIFSEYNNQKRYLLDFDIKTNNEVKDEPDITGIIENKVKRNPNVFIEIKNTSEKDRWIGLTEEQYNTIKRSAGKKKIYLVYASIRSKIRDNNPKTTDLTGMFLKEIEDTRKSTIFQKFAILNAECKIEFILSSEDLDRFSFPFERGMNMYNTLPFEERNRTSYYCSHGTRADVFNIEQFSNFDSYMILNINNSTIEKNEEISKFKITGNFKLIYKKISTHIECLSDVLVDNIVFGKFLLKKHKFYTFNLATVGRDPKLKRNNLFISKHRIYQLLENKDIPSPEERVKEIVGII